MGSRLTCFRFEQRIPRQTLVRGSIKFDISRRANDERDPHSPRRFYFHTARWRNECNSNAALIYREAKALIKIIPSLVFREEIAADHLSDAHQRRRFIAFERCVIYRRYYCETSDRASVYSNK